MKEEKQPFHPEEDAVEQISCEKQSFQFHHKRKDI